MALARGGAPRENSAPHSRHAGKGGVCARRGRRGSVAFTARKACRRASPCREVGLRAGNGSWSRAEQFEQRPGAVEALRAVEVAVVAPKPLLEHAVAVLSSFGSLSPAAIVGGWLNRMERLRAASSMRPSRACSPKLRAREPCCATTLATARPRSARGSWRFRRARGHRRRSCGVGHERCGCLRTRAATCSGPTGALEPVLAAAKHACASRARSPTRPAATSVADAVGAAAGGAAAAGAAARAAAVAEVGGRSRRARPRRRSGASCRERTASS